MRSIPEPLRCVPPAVRSLCLELIVPDRRRLELGLLPDGVRPRPLAVGDLPSSPGVAANVRCEACFVRGDMADDPGIGPGTRIDMGGAV